jgi:carboxyl-terminal processing protease
MNHSKLSAILAAAALAVGIVSFSPLAPADNTAATATPAMMQQTSLDTLKSQALTDLRSGQWDQTHQLLATAASQSNDPVIHQMADWAQAFDAQNQTFSAERHKEYNRVVAQVKLLAADGYTDYAIDRLKEAYVLADDKNKFVAEPWVASLIQQAITRSAADEKSEDWLKAVRLYSDLANVQPSEAQWKDELKVATRHFRLMAEYAADDYLKTQDKEEKARDAAEKLLADAHLLSPDEEKAYATAATKPAEASATTRPSKDVDDETAADAYKVDWHDTLKGIQMDMLRDALDQSKADYFRQVSFKTLGVGGLNGVEAVVTTKLLKDTFPGMADEAKRQTFLQSINDDLAEVKASNLLDEHDILFHVLDDLEKVNSQTVKLPEEVLVSEFADGAFGQLDPFSTMIWPSDVAEFNKDVQGEFTGVGIEIDSGDDGSLQVVSPLEDTPAYKAGIQAGDIIAAINGKSAKGVTTTEAVRLITGPAGTPVTLTIKSPDGVSRDLKIIRQKIKVSSVKGYTRLPGGEWNYLVDPDSKIAYLRITQFTKTTPDELGAACKQIQAKGARGLIMDLRGNPGGLLNAATEVCDKFLTDCVIVSTHADRADSPNPPTIATAHDDGDELTMPMVVLVNQYSASASEITSGALKDDHRATIVGERTFGKGSVQMLLPIGDQQDCYLKLTTAHYYLPSGRCIHREENSKTWGVDPDVTVEMTPDQMLKVMQQRRDLDVLRDAADKEKPKQVVGAAQSAINSEKAKAADPLEADPQLSAGLLVLRLQLAGNSDVMAKTN